MQSPVCCFLSLSLFLTHSLSPSLLLGDQGSLLSSRPVILSSPKSHYHISYLPWCGLRSSSSCAICSLSLQMYFLGVQNDLIILCIQYFRFNCYFINKHLVIRADSLYNKYRKYHHRKWTGSLYRNEL